MNPDPFEPFGMLHACHERVQRMLALLSRLRAHVAQHGCDAQASQAARDVMRYFDQAAPLHHQDEERHVFVALRASGTPQDVALVERLNQDHRAMEHAWAQVRVVLQVVADAADAPGPADAISAQTRPAQALADCGAQLDAFAALYAAHIEAEEALAYPHAQECLGADALRAMRNDMVQRRGISTALMESA